MVFARLGKGHVGLVHPGLGGRGGLGDAGGLSQLLQVHLEQFLLRLGLDARAALRRELALGESVRHSCSVMALPLRENAPTRV